MAKTAEKQESRITGKQRQRRQPASGNRLTAEKQKSTTTKQQASKEARERKRKIGLTKDNRCWVCKEPLQQPAKGRLRLTCSNDCRQARYRRLHGKMSWKFKREKKLVERRRSKPFIERKFDKTFFEPVFELNAWRKVYECLACGQPYLVERMKNGNPPRPYCSDACEQKSKYHWEKFIDAYERAHQRGELDRRVEERFWYDKLSPLCPRCGKPFAPNTTLFGKRKPGRPRKYCSDACRKDAYEQRWKNKHRRARVHRYRGCAECGEKFDRTDSIGRRNKRFCTPKCSDHFKTRAARARKRMGLKALVWGGTGHRAAALGVAKHRAKCLLVTNLGQ